MLIAWLAAASLAPDAETIFSNCRKAAAQAAFPRYAHYATVVSFNDGATHVHDTWNTDEDMTHHAVWSSAFSREERARPHVPHGTNVAFRFPGGAGIVVNPERERDPIGQTALAVDQDFGIAPVERAYHAVRTQGEATGSITSLPVIGSTRTRARDYDVRLLETTSDTVGPQYHLALTPLHDPARLRLRELWVDGMTWLPEEAVVSGIGRAAPLATTGFRVEFQRIAGGLYLWRETALAPVHYGARTLTDLSVRFDELALQARPNLYAIGYGPAPALVDP